ncbi:MAG: ATP-binding cassette domain-containing protein [Anaerolineae bacterium]|nr:ATP-binding cassette domain-containing protein [Anaerolineae bacterium]NIN94165.1 ATP-binding cassette domain-containing protein [Anaerolineae bacterium]NIQ77207.1 ATP-binding cassette domain-containing protein [Anaerolineae bacterium]
MGAPLVRALRFLSSYKLEAVGAFISLLLGTFGGLIVPRLTQVVIDEGISAGALNVIIWGAVGIVIAALVAALFTFVRGYLAAKASQGVAYDLRNALYMHIQRLSFSYHDRAQTGQLLTRATSDVELVRMFIGTGLLQLASALLMMIGSLILLFRINWQLTLMTLPVMLLVFGVFGLFAGRGRPLFIQVQQKLGRLNTVLQENLAGVRVVKAFARERWEGERFGLTNLELRDAGLRVGRMFAFVIPLIFTIANLGTLTVVWGGGYQVIADRLTIGELVAFQSYLMMTMFPMIMLGMIIMAVSQAGAGAERIFEILDTEVEVTDRPDAAELPPIEGRVEFENVTFRYFRDQEPVLNGVSFIAEPGQTVALFGATGSGKSTVINLIPRFYDVSEGRVTLDGRDVRDVTLESLRHQIGIVLQETVLFGGTIRENIAYGRPDATEEEITAAAQAAEAHDFIMSFPDGYDTAVGERGVTLSGGQKQRIAIARALLVDPRILILDDSTSSVDMETEYRIQQALERLRGGRTSFVIAQRISTVQSADLVVVLDAGEVAAIGTHQELLERSPIYAEIYCSQLEDDRVPGPQAEMALSVEPGRGVV